MRFHTLPLAFIFVFLHCIVIVHSANTKTVEEVAVNSFFNRNAAVVASESAHTNNWAVLVCASRYWFNYRVCSIDPHYMHSVHP
jgi:GPI-anchor transamidase subunit K